MDQHPPSFPAFSRDALRPQWTGSTYRPVELEGLQAVDPSRAIRPLSRRHVGVGYLSRGTGATARRQVDNKVILGEALPVGPARRPGHQRPSRLGKGLAGAAVAVSGIAHGFRRQHAGVDSLSSTSSSAPRLSGALPGNTSTAVISWESVSTTIAALCPSNRRLLLLCPWRISGSWTDSIRSRLTPSLRLRLTPSSPSPLRRWMSLEQQLSQQLRRLHNPRPLRAAGRQLFQNLPGQLQQPVRVGHDLPQQLAALPEV